MTLPQEVRQVVPRATAEAWETIAPVLPPGLYLAGGTALAVHLAHRVSNDLASVPGNPWFICTLWLADYFITRANTPACLGQPFVPDR